MSLSEFSFRNRLYFIAEVGVNHEGSLDNAKELIFRAKEAGADAVKFQSYKAEKLAIKDSPAYWDTTKETTSTQRELFKKYDSFNFEDYFELYNYCNKLNIDFASTPFDEEFVDQLNPILKYYKIASADITNFKLINSPYLLLILK